MFRPDDGHLACRVQDTDRLIQLMSEHVDMGVQGTASGDCGCRARRPGPGTGSVR
ncbi:hypothetical protein KNE206_57450 [Kitasatospora sp. NE20-6]